MSSDLERSRQFQKEIWDEVETLSIQATKQCEATYNLTVFQLNEMAKVKLAKLYSEQPGFKDDRYTKPPTPPTEKE